MTRIHLATGLALRDDRVLLVASHYPSHPEPLWNLPGGRQQHGELLAHTVARETREETGLEATVGDVAYVSESYDGAVHVLNVTFTMSVRGEITLPTEGDHVTQARWIARADLAQYLAVAVVREPLLAYLDRARRYAGYPEAGISVRWPDENASRSTM
ncbi:MAG: NUDIX hydrolase [bacterium]|nr:NUDIX hydrolase [bacterium]